MYKIKGVCLKKSCLLLNHNELYMIFISRPSTRMLPIKLLSSRRRGLKNQCKQRCLVAVCLTLTSFIRFSLCILRFYKKFLHSPWKRWRCLLTPFHYYIAPTELQNIYLFPSVSIVKYQRPTITIDNAKLNTINLFIPLLILSFRLSSTLQLTIKNLLYITQLNCCHGAGIFRRYCVFLKENQCVFPYF